jgi:hypothetical protein
VPIAGRAYQRRETHGRSPPGGLCASTLKNTARSDGSRHAVTGIPPSRANGSLIIDDLFIRIQPPRADSAAPKLWLVFSGPHPRLRPRVARVPLCFFKPQPPQTASAAPGRWLYCFRSLTRGKAANTGRVSLCFFGHSDSTITRVSTAHQQNGFAFSDPSSAGRRLRTQRSGLHLPSPIVVCKLVRRWSIMSLQRTASGRKARDLYSREK